MPGSGRQRLSPENVLYGRLGSRYPRGAADARVGAWSPQDIDDLGIVEHGYYQDVDGEWSGSRDWTVKTDFLPSAWTSKADWILGVEHQHLIQQINDQYRERIRLVPCAATRAERQDDTRHPAYGTLLSYFSVQVSKQSRRVFSLPSSQLRAVETLAPAPGAWCWAEADRDSEAATAGEALFYVGGEGTFPIHGNVRIPQWYKEPDAHYPYG